ncbi:MAG: DUF4252 domain-containing protein [Odoribacter sp.]|nr:DUF4252 domain-containing protein [Odoribacter sp.]
MKKFIMICVAGIWSILSANAQLGKQMSKYLEKDGVSVTRLDKSLYGLYQRENLRPEALEMLQRLEEINLLHLDLDVCPADLSDELTSHFRNILDRPTKYRLMQSRQKGLEKLWVYLRNKNERITDLVVWHQTPFDIDLIELRGDVQPGRIALLEEALNLPEWHILSSLFSDTPDNRQTAEEEPFRPTERNGQNLDDEWANDFDSLFNRFFAPGFRNDSTSFPRNPFAQMDRMMDLFGDFPFSDITFPKFSGENGTSRSSSVQIIEENGKTKLNIDSENTNLVYIIDGQEAPQDSVQMPERIRDVRLIPSRQDDTKTYLFITSQEKLGQFVSFTNGELTFRYNQQEFKYNLDKLNAPILIIDGRPSSVFNVEPSDILQIRPLSQTEKEAGFPPDAEVIINTRQEF